MKEISHQMLPQTRSEVILGYVRTMTRQTPASFETYSEDLLQIWLARTPADARSDDLNTGVDLFARVKANGQKLRRWANPDIPARPPIDIEEALVLALPQPYRGQCLTELASRFGGLFIDLPEGAVTLGLAGELLASVGETCTKLAPVLADNRIDENDSEESLLELRAAASSMQAKLAGLLLQVDAALEQKRARAAQEGRQAINLRSVR